MTTKPTRGLTAAPNAAARMQELLRQQAAPAKEESAAEEVPAYLNTQISNYASEQVIDPPREQAINEVRSEVRQGVSTPVVPTPASNATNAENLHTRITSRLGTKDGKEATVRLSIDVSERLHERIKVYCASNRIPTTRALVVALLENLLDEAGY
jgi:hypothetical protein